MKLNYKKKTDEIKCGVLFNLMDHIYIYIYFFARGYSRQENWSGLPFTPPEIVELRGFKGT